MVRVAAALAAAAVIGCCALVVSAGAASSAPAFVQQVTAHGLNLTKLTLTPSSNVTAGNRLVVLVGVWSNGAATAKSVTDSAGNTYVELLHFKASDNTEMSVWSAPITAGGGTRPTITVTPTAKADVGAAVSEYSGLSTAPDASVRRPDGARERHHQRSGHRRVRRHRPDHCGQRPRDRHVRRLRIREDPDRRRRIHAAFEHLRRLGHGSADRGPAPGRLGRDSERHRRHGREHGVADGDGRAPGGGAGGDESAWRPHRRGRRPR